ncbi:hypothetical protein CHS0354_013722, partial [Potamilus streckersoni]
MPKSRFYFNEDQLITTLTSERPMQVLSPVSENSLSVCTDDQILPRCAELPSQGPSDHDTGPRKNPLDMTLELPGQATGSQRVTLSCMNIISQPLVPKEVVADTPLDLSTLFSKFVTSPPKKILMSKNQNRARKLLKAGCMPLFPPARRDWDKEEIVEFTAGPVSIRWPPRSWKKMSADGKLLSVEYAAMTLEASLTPGHIPNIDRGDLIDRYNPLVLPGTSFVLTDHPFRKYRYYNNEVLCIIAIGQDIPDSSRFLDILEESVKGRDQSLETILSIIEKAK